MIFLDQPVNVGYSYSSDGSTVNNSPVAAEDVYAFLELFLERYPEYSQSPFHIAAESYGGVYAPNIASVIYKKNAELASKALAPAPRPKHINLHSVILANGITEPYTQFGSIPEFACNGPYPVFPDPDGAQCQSLRMKVPTCQRLIQGCYNFNSRFTCVPATLYCWSQLVGPLQRMYHSVCPLSPHLGLKSLQKQARTLTTLVRNGMPFIGRDILPLLILFSLIVIGRKTANYVTRRCPGSRPG